MNNQKRAANAAKAITTYKKEAGTDMESVLSDLLCDLIHWADVENYDFHAALERAKVHYKTEVIEEHLNARAIFEE